MYSALKEFFTLPVALVGCVAFSVAALVTRFMIHVNIHDTPVHRSSHNEVTPRSGGVGIIVGFGVCMAYFLSKHYLDHIPYWKLIAIAVASLGTILVSIRDDISGVSLRYKLLTQIVAASVIVASGFSFDQLPLPHFGVLELGAFGGILSLLWVIFFTNAFNFMDGLDGLAAGSSTVASFFGVIIGVLFKEHAFLYISFALFCSNLGFLVYNLSPARIFMGDVGSQFLGLIWSIMLLLSTQAKHMELSVYTVPILFFAFIYDVLLTILRRLVNGQSIWLPHRTFLFHILNRSGLSHRRISVIYMGFALTQGVGAVFVQFIPVTHQIAMLLPYFVLMIIYTGWVRHKSTQHTKRALKA